MQIKIFERKIFWKTQELKLTYFVFPQNSSKTCFLITSRMSIEWLLSSTKYLICRRYYLNLEFMDIPDCTGIWGKPASVNCVRNSSISENVILSEISVNSLFLIFENFIFKHLTRQVKIKTCLFLSDTPNRNCGQLFLWTTVLHS